MSKPDGIHWEWAEHCRKHTQKGSFILTACCRNEQEQRAAMQARAAADEQTPALPYLCADADGRARRSVVVTEWDSMLTLDEGGLLPGQYMILGGLLAPWNAWIRKAWIWTA